MSHIGTSTHCGHYVAHIYKDGRWAIFNDEKVGVSKDPPKDMGYLYFFERLDSWKTWYLQSWKSLGIQEFAKKQRVFSWNCTDPFPNFFCKRPCTIAFCYLVWWTFSHCCLVYTSCLENNSIFAFKKTLFSLSFCVIFKVVWVCVWALLFEQLMGNNDLLGWLCKGEKN